jgi:hypothetical protein
LSFSAFSIDRYFSYRGVAGIIEGELDLSAQRANETALAVGDSSDFVWAIRLTRIKKDLFGSGFKHQSYVKGATYALEDEDDVKELLAQEGVNPEAVHVVNDQEGEDGEEVVFVLPGAEP